MRTEVEEVTKIILTSRGVAVCWYLPVSASVRGLILALDMQHMPRW